MHSRKILAKQDMPFTITSFGGEGVRTKYMERTLHVI